MTRQYAKSAVVKRSILEACLTAFGESGFHGTSMAEIARVAGVSYTGLLYHFPRKEDLLAAVLEFHDQQSAEFLSQHDALGPDSDPVEVLRGLIATLVRRSAGLTELSAVLTGEATAESHPAHAYVAARFSRIRRFLTRIFAALRDQGRLAVDRDPSMLAATSIAAIDGLNLQWLYERSAIDVHAAVLAHLRSLVPEL